MVFENCNKYGSKQQMAVYFYNKNTISYYLLDINHFLLQLLQKPLLTQNGTVNDYRFAIALPHVSKEKCYPSRLLRTRNKLKMKMPIVNLPVISFIQKCCLFRYFVQLLFVMV